MVYPLNPTHHNHFFKQTTNDLHHPELLLDAFHWSIVNSVYQDNRSLPLYSAPDPTLNIHFHLSEVCIVLQYFSVQLDDQ